MGENILFKNLDLLDVEQGRLRSGCQVLVKGNMIAEVSDEAIGAAGAQEIDLGGRTLMPGLIDCHVHVTAYGRKVAHGTYPLTYNTAVAAENLRGILMRGFTTVRDAAGADLGHKLAVEQGLFLGPRLFVPGRGVSQTGGHGDHRARADMCQCADFLGAHARIADGVDAVRHAVRDELRMGADQIKVMASGGVGSLADPIDYLQYSMDELRAVVDEAERAHKYVMAHVYTAEAIHRCVEAGVRTIEHGNLLDEKTARLMAAKGAYLVPTLVCYYVHQRMGKELGFAPENLAKSAQVFAAGTRTLEMAKLGGVKVAYGTDLANSPLRFQSEEFLIRAEVMSPAEIIRSATLIGAEVVRMEGKLGVVAPGALADLIVLDGNPLEDLGLFQDQGAHMPVIMKDGVIHKNTLAGAA